jgi:hypothetical protein
MVDELGDERVSEREWSSFHVHGILCELIDQTPYVEMQKRHNELSEDFSNSICNHLAAVEFATDLLVDSYQDLDSRRTFQQLIHDQVSQAATDIREARNSLKRLSTVSPTFFAVGPEHALESAIEVVRQSSREMIVNWDREQFRSHVLADFGLLQGMFETVLRTVTSNVASPNVVEIIADEEVDRIVFSVGQQGSFGDLSLAHQVANGRGVNARDARLFVGSETCYEQISKLGGTIIELTNTPFWRIRFSIPRFC